MIKTVKQTIDFYLKSREIPKKEEIKFDDNSLLEKKGALFVTLYKNGEIIGSSGNIIEIEQTIAEELIINTIGALNDERFPNTEIDIAKINIRVDLITNRTVLDEMVLKTINPVKNGIIAIKKDYSKLSVILPNISNSLVGYNDLIEVLNKKLGEEFKFENFIVYSIDTEVFRDF